LVEPEEVGRVILALQDDQALVVRAVHSLDLVFTLLAQKIDRDAAGQKGLCRVCDLAHPLDVALAQRSPPLAEDGDAAGCVYVATQRAETSDRQRG
jgi:hypothetical protein